MSNPAWYRSLYWRIAFGFVALLAVLLLVQALLFLWMTDRIRGTTGRTPEELAQIVATEVGAELERQPSLPLDPFVRVTFRHVYQPFLVGLHDGRRGSNRAGALPQGLDRAMQVRLATGGRPADDAQPFGRRRGGPRVVFAPIVVDGAVRGYVAVPSTPPPFPVVLRDLGPTLAWVGLGLLGLGAALTAMLIFGPAHKRLRGLEQAARALGDGRTDVRAVESGGDEVTSLARTFNRMAADLATRAAALNEADRTRRQLLADVSHELMTPLTAIRGYTETLAMPGVPMDEATRRRYLGIVEQETGKLEAIIGDLLDLARLEGGGETLAFEQVPVAHLFRRVTDRHEPALRERHITLAAEIAPGTPGVHGDAARLEQALQNVAANAIRHTPEGGHVWLRAEPAGSDVRITVRDSGPGIPPEHLPRVFDRFYKADASRAGTPLPSGSGLGLSIVRAIVERHGGRVTATNLPEGGAAFELWLPAAGAAPPPATL